MSSIVYGGLDVHKDSIAACLLVRDTGEMVAEQLPNDRTRLLRAVHRWAKLGELHLCYEAGGAGFVLQRWLAAEGIDCVVIAPSRIPRIPGDRVKTDTRDARKLATLFAAGLLEPVRVPDPEDELVRAVVRLHAELTRDLTRSKNRALKYLATLGHYYRDGRPWTQKHRAWLTHLPLEPLAHLVLQTHLDELDHLQAQLAGVDRQIAEQAATARYQEGVQRLLSVKGIQVYSAMVLLTEIGDIRRFADAPHLMSYFGQVPREHSSGTRERRGPITKAGSSRVRWVLTEAAWHQLSRPGQCARVRQHRATQPPAVVAIAQKAEQRLHHTFWKLAARKDRRTAVTAVARELTGFIWALLSLPAA